MLLRELPQRLFLFSSWIGTPVVGEKKFFF